MRLVRRDEVVARVPCQEQYTATYRHGGTLPSCQWLKLVFLHGGAAVRRSGTCAGALPGVA